MPIVPTSTDFIKVSYIHQTKGLVKDVSVADANSYEELNPGTIFIFVNGDGKVRYLDITGVNNITITDLGRRDACKVGPQPCGPPTLHFFGGGGIGAEANPVVDSSGNIIAVDLINAGFGYSSAPKIQVIDPCQKGTGAVLKTEMQIDPTTGKSNGSVRRILVLDPGFGYLPKPVRAQVGTSSSPQYPVLIKLTDVLVANPGINYECGKDKLTITPNNGTVLSYKCDPFGKIKSVQVEKGGNFTELPRISLPTEQGLNARFLPVFEVIRDPFTPEAAPPSDVVQVFDLVGVNIKGYVDGKAYYGNVYFSEGIKYAGTSSTGGAIIRVYDTRQESISGSK